MEALERGLRWLAVKGFAMTQRGDGWTVRGLARRKFLDVYVQGGPKGSVSNGNGCAMLLRMRAIRCTVRNRRTCSGVWS